ncbi:MAG: efflux RND transporter permease subunit [Bacteroidota bacterium]
MNITNFALNNRVLLFVMVGLIAFAGLQAYSSLPRDEDPGYLVRTAVVFAAWPGASPERVERMVAIPMEEALEELEGMRNVRTVVQEGQVIVSLDIENSLPGVEPTWTEMREAIGAIVPTLPPGVIGPFFNDDFGDVFGIIVAISGVDYTPAELERAAEALRQHVLKLDDARSVQIDGALERRVFIEYDQAQLAALGVPVGYLVGQLQTRNVVAPGGTLRSGPQRVALRTRGAFASVEDIRAMSIRMPAGDVVALGDLATVTEGYAEPVSQRVRFSGKDAVSVGIAMKADGKLTEFGPQVLDVVAQTEADLPAGLDFNVVVYQPEVVDELTSEFVWSLIQAVLIVIGVLLLALGVRTGLVVAASIPLTMFAAFVCMALLGITINQMSLTALIVALGLLVDNSIVVSEQILTDTQKGMAKRTAALSATREMAFPLMVASACTAAALLPTYLAESSSAEYTAALFEVLAFSLAVSWLLAMTLIPVLCMLFLATGRDLSADQPRERVLDKVLALFGKKPKAAKPSSSTATSDDAYDSGLYRWYRGVLIGMVKRPWLSLGGFVAVLFGSFAVFGTAVPQQFFPSKSYKVFTIELDFPWGTAMETTDAVVADLEQFMADSLDTESGEAGVVQWASYMGSAAPRYTLGYAPEPPRPSYAYFLATASSPEDQPEVFRRVEDYMTRTHPEIVTRVATVRNGPALDYPFEVRISGPDPAVLEALAQDVRDEVRSMPGTARVGTDWGPRQPTLDVAVDHDAARRAGLSSIDVATSLQVALDGIPLTQMQQGEALVPVVIRSTQALSGAEALNQMDIFSQATGQAVPFRQVAETRLVYEPANIERYNGERTITVEADIALDAGPFVTPFSIQAQLEEYLATATASWPAGYTYAYGGDIEESVDSQDAINAKSFIAIVVILLLLVAQFNALRPPAIVVITLPFVFIGVTLGLVLTGYAFGFMPLLGTIALFGIVINNAVVLLDRIGTERTRDMAPEQALIHAAQQRLRPILLTAATTAGGLIPLWLSGNPLFAPMAVALLFGLVASSALTPGLVPVLYTLFYRLRFRGFTYDPEAGASTVPQPSESVMAELEEAHGDGSPQVMA